jgi:hypothetical protein
LIGNDKKGLFDGTIEESHRCTKNRLLFRKCAQKDNLQMAKALPNPSTITSFPTGILHQVEIDLTPLFLKLKNEDPLEEENWTNQSTFLKFSRSYFRP